MPLYEYCCKNDTGCGKIHVELRPVEKYLDPVRCTCGLIATLQLSAPGTRFDHLYPYLDTYMDANPIEIRSRSHYLNELRKRNLVEKERGKGCKGQWI